MAPVHATPQWGQQWRSPQAVRWRLGVRRFHWQSEVGLYGVGLRNRAELLMRYGGL